MEYTQHKRTGLSEMRPVNARDIASFKKHGKLNLYEESFIEVSISEADLKDGSPKEGDWIARNPQNHEDKWLVAKEYYEANLEAI